MGYRPFHFELLTHDKEIANLSIRSLVVPGEYGSLGILAHHVSLVANLVGGTIWFETEDGERREMDISGGILTVGDNQAVVLADQVWE